MPKKITVRQAIDFCNAFDALKDSGIVFKGLSLIDLADNDVMIRPLMRAWQKANEPSDDYKKYLQKLDQARIESAIPIEGKVDASKGQFDPPIDGQRFAKSLTELRAEFAGAIQTNDSKMAVQRELLDSEKEIDIIEISREQIELDPKNNRAAAVLSGLSIVLAPRMRE